MIAAAISKHKLARWTGVAAIALLPVAAAQAEPMATVDRNGSLVAIEPYAPNIVRVTIAVDRALADAAPGPGPNAKANAAGWTHRTDPSGDVFASSALSLTVAAQPWAARRGPADIHYLTARFITSIDGATPNQVSSAAAPCLTSSSRPSIGGCDPRWAAPATGVTPPSRR